MNKFFFYKKRFSLKIINYSNIKLNNINTIVTIGVFDGFHIGHRKLIKILNKKSLENNIMSLILTFYPHPEEIIYRYNFKYLTLNNEKLILLKKSNLQSVIFYPFTEKFSKIKFENFVVNFLLKKINMKYLIIGYDNFIGKNREGSYERLLELSKIHNFQIKKIAAYKLNNKIISSTKIRNYLKKGNLYLANKYLGYNYIISGVVVKGKQLGGNILGFPTANIKVNCKKLIPANGVYAVEVVINNNKYIGMLNIGINPTFGGKKVKLEVHILNFKEKIYNRLIYIYLIKYMRKEKKFNNILELKNQLKKDKEIVKFLYKKKIK